MSEKIKYNNNIVEKESPIYLLEMRWEENYKVFNGVHSDYNIQYQIGVLSAIEGAIEDMIWFNIGTLDEIENPVLKKRIEKEINYYNNGDGGLHELK